VSAERRERRGFEPPPWEKDQLGEVDSQKGEEPLPQAAPAQKPAEPAEPVKVQEEATQASAPVSEEVDPHKMARLISNLKDEEPTSGGYWVIGIAVAVFMAVLGAVMMIWGIVAFQATRGSGQLGWMAAAVLVAFGIGFIAVAGWLAYKNLQRQGVL